MQWAARTIAAFLLVFLSLAAFGDTLTGKVVKITDGGVVVIDALPVPREFFTNRL